MYKHFEKRQVFLVFFFAFYRYSYIMPYNINTPRTTMRAGSVYLLMG